MSKSLTLVELDLPLCENTYGVAPCTATLEGAAPTGTIKCFNTRGTCQDIENILPGSVTLRFSMRAQSYTPLDFDALPCIASVKFDPGRISLGKDLGLRSKVEIASIDFTHSDTGDAYDRYRQERSYDAISQGSYWGRFRARHLSVRGMGMRVRLGQLGDELEDMETRHYIADGFNGPTPKNGFAITARDVLKLADGDRTMVPPLNNGYLSAGIDSNDTSCTLSPAGIGDEEYPASGKAAIGGNEIVTFTRFGDTVTITGRGLDGTTAVDHDAEDRFQVARVYAAAEIPDIMTDIMVNDCGVPSTQAPTEVWRAETDSYLDQSYSAVIAQPTPARDLLNGLIEQAGLAVWPDEVEQVIRLQVLRGIDTNAAIFDTDTIAPGTLDWAEQPDQRASRVWVYYGLINPLERLDDPNNYRSSVEVIDSDAETLYGSPAIRVIYARWIPEAGRPVAKKLADIVLSRFARPPRRFTFETSRAATITPQPGGGYRLKHPELQTATGELESVPIQVTRVVPIEGRYRVEAEEMLYSAPADLGFHILTVETSQYNINLRDYHDQVYPEPDSETPVIITINPTVNIGSISTSLRSVEVGDWPDGVVPIIRLLGRCQGPGGRGGKGAQGNGGAQAQNGLPGGDAFYTRTPVKLDCSAGQLWSGAGAGAGGWADDTGQSGIANSGGGGAGNQPGLGGDVLGNNYDGAPGTTEAGGAPGDGNTDSFTDFGPHSAGAGGDPGEAGEGDGSGNRTGGDPGAAIDGVSFVTFGVWDPDALEFTDGLTGTEDIRGPQIN